MSDKETFQMIDRGILHIVDVTWIEEIYDPLNMYDGTFDMPCTATGELKRMYDEIFGSVERKIQYENYLMFQVFLNMAHGIEKGLYVLDKENIHYEWMVERDIIDKELYVIRIDGKKKYLIDEVITAFQKIGVR